MERLSPVQNRETQETVWEWKLAGYYGSVDQLRRAITTLRFKEQLRATEYESFSDFLNQYEHLAEQIQLAIAPDVPLQINKDTEQVQSQKPVQEESTEGTIKRGRGRPRKVV